MVDDGPSARPGIAGDPLIWPVVTPGNIVIADFEYDLAYMGVYLRLEICNRSPYLVREAQLRVDGRGQTVQKIVTSETITVGPLFPGVHVHEEVGIGRGRESAAWLSSPSQRVPSDSHRRPTRNLRARIPACWREIVEVTTDEEALDLRWSEDDHPPTTVATSIDIRVRNTGPAVVERARLGLEYFEAGAYSAGGHTRIRLVTPWRSGFSICRGPTGTRIDGRAARVLRSRGSPAARQGPRVHACPLRRRT